MSKWRRPAIVGALAVVVLVVGAVAFLYLVFPPSGAQAATTILSVISGEVLVQDAGAATPRPAVDGEVVQQGDRVITKADSRAVITFFEGSTQELEPDTDVTIQRLDFNERGTFSIRIGQSLGVTWNSVLQ